MNKQIQGTQIDVPSKLEDKLYYFAYRLDKTKNLDRCVKETKQAIADLFEQEMCDFAQKLNVYEMGSEGIDEDNLMLKSLISDCRNLLVSLKFKNETQD